MTISSLAPHSIQDPNSTEFPPPISAVAGRAGAVQTRPPTQLATLATLANDLAGEFLLAPLLDRILRNAVELLRCSSGSICTIDPVGQSYRKEVDLDVGCRSGEVFPLDEGITGAVVKAASAVRFDHYSMVPGGHIGAGDPRYSRAVIGVPIRLGQDVVGACIVFGDDSMRSFDEDDVQLLELFAIHAAVAIANSRVLNAILPSFNAGLTAREREVTSFLERGWPDKLIATELGISAKTVEKHVGTILRKTGARNRAEVAAGLGRADTGALPQHGTVQRWARQ